MNLKKIQLTILFFLVVFSSGVLIGEYSLLNIRKKIYDLGEKIYPHYKNYTNKVNVQLIKIEVDESDFSKIRLNRANALSNNYLSKKKTDYVPATFIWNDKKIKGKFRLKGVFKDHYEDEKKWSFRIKLKKDSLMNASSFVLQHPKTRNYLNEWLFQKYIQYINLIKLDYKFVRVEINNHDLGIYAFEESFTNKILRDNNLLIGPIIKFDEGRFFLDYVDESNAAKTDWFDYSNNEYLNSKVEIYNDERINDDTLFNSYFKKARDLLDSYRKNKILATSVFDEKKMSKYIASVNIFSGFHGLNWNNMRFYFNPKTSKLEPIAYDTNSSFDLEISPNHVEQLLLTRYLFNDTIFFKSYVNELYKMTKKSELDQFFKTIKSEFQTQENIISSEFFNYDNYPEKIYQKAQYIRKVIQNTYISDASWCLDENYITIYNSNKFPVKLLRIEQDNKVIYTFNKNNVVFKKPYLKSPEKIKYDIPLGENILNKKKLNIIYKVIGLEKEKKVKIEYFICE